jgi:hypothetical protein
MTDVVKEPDASFVREMVDVSAELPVVCVSYGGAIAVRVVRVRVECLPADDEPSSSPSPSLSSPPSSLSSPVDVLLGRGALNDDLGGFVVEGDGAPRFSDMPSVADGAGGIEMDGGTCD